ncbi:molybdopterin-guanine dinucleotide biosynthesis protein A [Rhizobium skierniewicense]|uniref:Molybdenum cofactor guanylyltransferase n=1 Tax=Rhizobium skierniewicense TaxID=984260 RepID=A0A7W6C8P3_9HYPH|nr:molybdenum cofactor guanylyltransferase MobA [Rhizobium skierniewicense]MBB3947727.1 molybdopterin-guanine dinucleotide biosynthesis protein A [Rhizobium skierniewicense]
MTSRQATPGLILAGGLSRRMGTNKALSQLGGKPLLTHVIERVHPQVSKLALNAAEAWAQTFELPLVPDTKAGHAGPLAGILAGMRYFANHAAQASHILTVPADSPFFPDDLSSRLADHIMQEDAIVIAASSGHVHPVFGLWPVSIADDLEHWLADDNNRRIRSFLARHHTLGVTFATLESETASIDPFYNINTPDELATAETFLRSMSV